MEQTRQLRQLILPLLILFLLAVPVRAADCDHEFAEMRQEPTCEEGGLSWQQCVLCGYKTGYTFLDAVGHAFGGWYVMTEPTCTKEGVQARDCAVCDFRESAPIDRLDHSYAAEIRHPTCTASGYTRYNCRSCTDYYIADYTQPLGHRYDSGVLIKEPTDTARGQVRFTCIRCSESHLMTYAFRDLDCDAYYFTPVMWAVDTGIATGLDAAHFGPGQPCNRAQVVTFLWRRAGKPTAASQENPFEDVPAGSFYEQAVLWAAQSGITNGTDARHFSPDAICNRAQVVTFLHRFRSCPEPELTGVFPDVPEGSFFCEAVHWAAGQGITLGMDDGRFHPELSCIRAQIVTFLYRDAQIP